jgi:hypothetical protein
MGVFSILKKLRTLIETIQVGASFTEIPRLFLIISSLCIGKSHVY